MEVLQNVLSPSWGCEWCRISVVMASCQTCYIATGSDITISLPVGHSGTVDTLGLWTPWDCGHPGTVDSLTRNQCTVCVYSTVQTERSPVPTMAPLTVQSSSVFITESHNKGDLQTRRLHSPLANINQSINCLKLFRLLPRPLLSNISISLNIYFKLCQLQFLHWLDVLNFWAIWKSFTYVHLHM